MTVRVYRSTDTGAPTLSGVVGSLTTLLDAVLVNGYNTNDPPGSGWTIDFTATDIRSYRQGTGSNQFYLRVNDSGAGAGDEAAGTPNAKEARIRGYESMTTASAGLNLFPTVAQMANGLFVRKSATADATTRPWIIVADQRTLYMFVLTGDVANTYSAWIFGEFYSLKTNDGGRCILIGRNVENNATFTSVEFTDLHAMIGQLPGGHYISRSVQGSIGSFTFTKGGDFSVLTGTQTSAVSLVAYKNPADSQIYLSPVWVMAQNSHLRGRIRGMWQFCHANAGAADGDTITGSGDLEGKTFLIIKLSGNGGLYCIETSDTWETN